MTFNIKVELDQGYIDEYYGNISQEFGEMLRDAIRSEMKKFIIEELKKDELGLAAECRKVISSLGLKMNPVEIADLAYALVDSTVKEMQRRKP